MPWADMALSGGLSMMRDVNSFIGAQQKAEAQAKWQAYKNTMTNLSNAQNQNALTTNEILTTRRSVDQGFDIAKQGYITQGQSEVQAAASGTEGNSVNMTLSDIERNTDVAQARRKADLDAQYAQIDNERIQSDFQAARQMDYSPIPQPSGAALALGLTTDAYSAYRSNTKAKE